MIRPRRGSPLFPYTTLFRSFGAPASRCSWSGPASCPTSTTSTAAVPPRSRRPRRDLGGTAAVRSEEHTSELQSHHDLVCRLLLEKKKNDLLSRYRTHYSLRV